MPKYTLSVEMYHAWYSTEKFEIEIEANNESDALWEARREALRQSEPDYFEAELNNSEIESLQIISAEALPTEEVRCDKTPDLFTPSPVSQ